MVSESQIFETYGAGFRDPFPYSVNDFPKGYKVRVWDPGLRGCFKFRVVKIISAESLLRTRKPLQKSITGSLQVGNLL